MDSQTRTVKRIILGDNPDDLEFYLEHNPYYPIESAISMIINLNRPKLMKHVCNTPDHLKVLKEMLTVFDGIEEYDEMENTLDNYEDSLPCLIEDMINNEEENSPTVLTLLLENGMPVAFAKYATYYFDTKSVRSELQEYTRKRILDIIFEFENTEKE